MKTLKLFITCIILVIVDFIWEHTFKIILNLIY
jgi:hypothetical protein